MGVELARNKVARIRKGIEDGREPTAFARPAANVAQSFEIYVASSGFLREWRSKVRLTFERRILPDLGHLTLSALTASAIDRAIRSQARPASMARQDFYIVRAFLKWAVVHMRVDANVLAGVPAPARGMRRKTGLYLEDLQYIWACAAGLAPPWPGFFRIAILTGKSSSQVIKMQGRDLPWRREMWGEEQIEPDLREAMVEAFSSLPDWNDYLFTRTENGTPMWFRQRVMTQLRHLCQIGRFTCQEIQSAVRRETAAGLYDQLQWARVLMLPAPPSLITDDEVVL
jgi:integrase